MTHTTVQVLYIDTVSGTAQVQYEYRYVQVLYEYVPVYTGTYVEVRSQYNAHPLAGICMSTGKCTARSEQCSPAGTVSQQSWVEQHSIRTDNTSTVRARQMDKILVSQ